MVSIGRNPLVFRQLHHIVSSRGLTAQVGSEASVASVSLLTADVLTAGRLVARGERKALSLGLDPLAACVLIS